MLTPPKKPLTKAQLVAELAARMQVDKATARRALEAVSAVITKEVANGGAVTLPDIGKLSAQDRPPRLVRNPLTGGQFRKPAHRVVTMSVAKRLREIVNA